jgi:hypothetical protein
MLYIKIINARQYNRVRHDRGALELGSGPGRDTKRLIIDDPLVSADQLFVQENGEFVRIKNTGESAVEIGKSSELHPGESRDLEPPVCLTVGQTAIEIAVGEIGELLAIDRDGTNEKPFPINPEDDLTTFGGPVEYRGGETLPLDENVQFSVFRPASMRPAEWYPLVAFAHLDRLFDEVRNQAIKLIDQFSYRTIVREARHPIVRKSELSFVPHIDGVEFNPNSNTLQWVEDIHKVEFRMMASNELEAQTVRGRLSVFGGALLLAEVPLQIDINHQSRDDRESQPRTNSAPLIQKIFASYSRKDTDLVRQVEEMVSALGLSYLRDCNILRSGERWSERLKEMIDDADLFQLFWSSNSMRSMYVKEEWEYALSLRRPGFVRPTYWETPFPECRDEQLPPDELRALHFSRLPVV